MRFVARIAVNEISAAHHLPGYPGDCARLHGHNWGFVATVGADHLAADMVIDFALIKDVFRALNHTCLNDDPDITADGHRPTTERLAEVLAARLQRVCDALPNHPQLLALSVRETGRNEVVFTP